MKLPEIEEIPETVNISITVQDENEEPISGASVRIDEISSTTGVAGGCTLQNVPEGNQTILVTATGYEDHTETINVSSENDTFTIILTEE